MQSYYKTKESVYNSKCELLYLINLLKFLDAYLRDNVNLQHDYERIYKFKTNATAELKTLKKDFNKINIQTGWDIEELELIAKKSTALNMKFQNEHLLFIEKINEHFNYHVKIYSENINNIISNTQNYITNNSLNEEITRKLTCIITYLENIRTPLLKHFKNIIPEDYLNSVSPDYNTFSSPDDAKEYMRKLSNKYTKILDQLHYIIKHKMIFCSMPNERIATCCNSVKTITNESPLTLTKFTFLNETKNEVMARKMNLKTAYDCIINNRDFFIAAFSEDTFDEFQNWAKDNIELIKELSDNLLSFFPNKTCHASITFTGALVGYNDEDTDCLLTGDDSRLNKFLLNPVNYAFAVCLASHSNNPVYLKWRNDNKKNMIFKY